MKLTPEIREAIRRLMADKGLQQKDLAQELDVSAMTVSRWLRGEVDRVQALHWARLEMMLREYMPSKQQQQASELGSLSDTVARRFRKLSEDRQRKVLQILLEDDTDMVAEPRAPYGSSSEHSGEG